MSRPRLPAVLKEIAEKLVQDNWCRISTRNRDQFYYIVGFDEQTAGLNGQAEFSIWDFPLPTAPGPLAESVSRSQVAEQNNYLENARKDFQKAGVPRDAILSFEERILAGDPGGLEGLLVDGKVSLNEWAKLFSNLVDALRLAHTNAHPLKLGPDEVAEADSAREKRCLREVTSKYPALCGRRGKSIEADLPIRTHGDAATACHRSESRMPSTRSRRRRTGFVRTAQQGGSPGERPGTG